MTAGSPDLPVTGPAGDLPPVPVLSRATVDRAAHRRLDEQWLAEASASPQARAFAVDRQGRVLVTEDGEHPRLDVRRPQDFPGSLLMFLGEEPAGAVADAADGGDGGGLVPPDGGVPWFAAGVDALPRSLHARPATLRDLGADLTDREAGLLVHAVALQQWHDGHRHCPRCGAATEPVAGGTARRCTAEGGDHFPRTDPAVIMLVHDGGRRAVLGRSPAWPPRRFSVLAGFVEAGESAEQAVAREVQEEVGLAVGDLRYVASQPWPFPRSLMLAFTARALGDHLRVDPVELAEARWWDRDELGEAIARGEVLVPPPASVARLLLDGWLAGRLPAR